MSVSVYSESNKLEHKFNQYTPCEKKIEQESEKIESYLKDVYLNDI